MCSIGCSGRSSSCFFFSVQDLGGATTSLTIKVPYTRRMKPTTCSHLNVSQPNPRLTSQMKSVRQVSIVARGVADRKRVTDKPKKLKLL